MNSQERKEMCEIHFGMVEVVVDELLSRSRNHKYKPHRNDFLGEAYIELVKTSEKFDDQRGFQFRTYASNAIRYALIRAFKRIDKQTEKEVCIDDLVDTTREPRTEVDEAVNDRDYDRLVKMLEPADPLHKIVYHELIVGENSFRKLAKELGNENERKIYKIKHKILRDIRQTLQEKNLYENYR